jgi:hypothetical protein
MWRDQYKLCCRCIGCGKQEEYCGKLEKKKKAKRGSLQVGDGNFQDVFHYLLLLRAAQTLRFSFPRAL